MNVKNTKHDSNGYTITGAAGFNTPAIGNQPGAPSVIKKSSRKPDRYANGGNNVDSQIAEEDLKFMINSPPESKGKALKLQTFQSENPKVSK